VIFVPKRALAAFRHRRVNTRFAIGLLAVFALCAGGAYAAAAYRAKHNAEPTRAAGVHNVTSDDVHQLAPGYYTLTSTAYCPSGERALGGGFFHSRGAYQARGANVAGDTSVWYSGPAAKGTAWSVSADVYTNGGRYELQAFATCAAP
jgi:hypothetical protein